MMTSRSKYARRRASCSSKVEDNHEDKPLRREDVAAVGDGEVEDRRNDPGEGEERWLARERGEEDVRAVVLE